MNNLAIAENVSKKAKQILNDNLVWDNHGCMPLRGDDTTFLPQLKRYHDAGVNVVSLNVGFDAVHWGNTLLVIANFRLSLFKTPSAGTIPVNIQEISERIGEASGGRALVAVV